VRAGVKQRAIQFDLAAAVTAKPSETVKSGCTRSLDGRMRALRDGMPEQRTSLLAVLPGDQRLENHVHKLLMYARVKNEFFQLDAVIEFLSKVNHLLVSVVPTAIALDTTVELVTKLNHRSTALAMAHDAAAFTVQEFCRAHRIGETHYYEMKKAGLGPVEMIVGRRRVISMEAPP